MEIRKTLSFQIEDFPERLREAIAQSRSSVTQIAAKSGVTVSYIYKLLRGGGASIPEETLLRLATVLDADELIPPLGDTVTVDFWRDSLAFQELIVKFYQGELEVWEEGIALQKGMVKRYPRNWLESLWAIAGKFPETLG